MPRTGTEFFYFGETNRQLFGAFHEAETYAQRETGVVVCYPFGDEYVRAHRACRQLALRLARVGFPTLRFDYGGTGDSAGEAEDVSLADWQRDIRAAIEFIRRRTGVEEVCLAGLRLGASLAYHAAESSSQVKALILWDPILSGSGYLTELRDSHREVLWRYFDDFDQFDTESFTELLGSPISAALRDEFEQLNLAPYPPAGTNQILIAEDQPNPASELLCKQLQESACPCTYQYVPSFATWREDVDKGLVPDQVLRSIVDWTTEQLP